MEELNTCDKCNIKEESISLIWIDSEDFKPLKSDNFNKKSFENAINKDYSALCEKCYIEECLN